MSFDYRRPWTPEEDTAITSLVEEFGLKKWAIVAQNLAERFGIKHRSGKQCRERWHNHLDSSVDKKPWTQEEDDLIFELHSQFGKSWSKIAENIPGRTDNSVKNRFYSTLRRNLRKYNKSRPHSQRIIGSVRTILRNPDIPQVLLQEHAPPRLRKNKESFEKTEKNSEKLERNEETSENSREKIEENIVSPVLCQPVAHTKISMDFERFTKQIEDANLLFGLTQPELNYFYFYPQALANYKDQGSLPTFINPLFPPMPFPMIIPQNYLKPDSSINSYKKEDIKK